MVIVIVRIDRHSVVVGRDIPVRIEPGAQVRSLLRVEERK